MKTSLIAKRLIIIAFVAISAVAATSFRSGSNNEKDPMVPMNLTDTNFDEVTSKGVVLVDFWAAWCRPCRMMAPAIDTLAMEMGKKAVIAKLDVDKNPATSRRFAVTSIPTVIIFKNGQAVKRMVGLQSKEALSAALNEVLDKKPSAKTSQSMQSN